MERTLLLAKAHRLAAGALDDPLRRALDFWLSNDPIGTDWRQNQIVIPRLVGEIALLCDGSLSSGAADKVLEILARSRWANWAAPAGWVECSGVEMLGIAYNHLLRGCLESAPAFFDSAFGRIFREFRQAKPGEGGIRPDMTFHAPGGQSMADGLVFTRESAQFIALAHGTPWQAPAEAVKLFVGFLLDGQQWMLRQGMAGTEAPAGVPAEPVDPETLAVVMQQLAQSGNPPRRSELAAFVRRLQGQGEALSGHRYFWQARMSVHQRPAFYASLRLAPAPVADGRTCFLRTGRDCQETDFSTTDQAPAGSTAFSGADAPFSEETSSGDWAASGSLAGGVSEGDYGLAVTELKRTGLSGKKAWFFFDESVVCLGTGLQGTLAGRRVCTTINRSRLRGPVVAGSADGERRLLASGEGHTRVAVRTLEHDGIRYVFPEPTNVLVHSSGPVTGMSADSSAPPAAFCVEIDHGAQPREVSWACIVLPTGDDPEAAARVADEVERLDILANTPALQAVCYQDIGLLAVAFWEPGTVRLADGRRVAANHACVLLCREIPGGGTRLSISTLTNQPATIHVEYGGQCVAFELAGGPDAGRSTSRFV